MKKLLCAAGLVLLLLAPACGKSDQPAEPAQAPPGVTNPYETQMQVLNKAKDLANTAKARIAAEQEREKALEEASGLGQ